MISNCTKTNQEISSKLAEDNGCIYFYFSDSTHSKGQVNKTLNEVLSEHKLQISQVYSEKPDKCYVRCELEESNTLTFIIYGSEAQALNRAFSSSSKKEEWLP